MLIKAHFRHMFRHQKRRKLAKKVTIVMQCLVARPILSEAMTRTLEKYKVWRHFAKTLFGSGSMSDFVHLFAIKYVHTFK